MCKARRFYLYNFLGNILPGSGRFVNRIRCALLRWCGCKIGKDVRIDQYVHFSGTGEFEIGDNSWIAAEVWIQGTGLVRLGNNVELMYKSLVMANGNSKVVIGDHTRIAHCVSIKTTSHKIDVSGPSIGGGCIFTDIIIGFGCWICSGAIITPGVHLGNKCVVAAGAVVLEDIPCENGVLFAGVPAQIKKRY